MEVFLLLNLWHEPGIKAIKMTLANFQGYRWTSDLIGQDNSVENKEFSAQLDILN